MFVPIISILFVLLAEANCGGGPRQVHAGLAKALQNDDSLTENQLGEGIEVDKSFIQIRSNEPGILSSSPGCPSPTDGYPWVKFGTPTRCYLTGFQGPCPLYMKMLYNQNSPEFGYCQCDCFDNDPSSPFEYYCMRKPSEWDLDSAFRAYGFSSETKSCYALFSQGPCQSDEWFVLDPSGTKSICKKRRCRHPRDPHELIFYSSKTQSCQELDAQCRPESNFGRAYNAPGDGNPSTYKYTFIKSTWIPQCIYREYDSAFGSIAPVGEFDCEKGTTFSKLLKRCITPFRKFSGNIG
ncbi:uncharacterized protein LOC110863404 [Folsomia candida]|uniref:uncharacterized protein LOC110863404 n=1 Tax=Folsomia candida TaxID=158441 RepID=UPI000B8F9907|nr:uncharacterized protein LOC110863404 [Folsomia candida]